MYAFNKASKFHPEFHFQQWKNGIKLIRPDALSRRDRYASNRRLDTAHLLQLPISVYFLNCEGAAQAINEKNAMTLGFSAEEIIGKSAFDFLQRKSDAERVRKNDVEVMTTSSTGFYLESGTVSNGLFVDALTIKTPWYDDQNRIAGVFGFAIQLNTGPVGDALSIISASGLSRLSHAIDSYQRNTDGVEIGGVYFSPREKQCLHYIIRGKTARETAARMGLSARTVEQYIENIKMKMSVSSKSELIDKLIFYLLS